MQTHDIHRETPTVEHKPRPLSIEDFRMNGEALKAFEHQFLQSLAYFVENDRAPDNTPPGTLEATWSVILNSDSLPEIYSQEEVLINTQDGFFHILLALIPHYVFGKPLSPRVAEILAKINKNYPSKSQPLLDDIRSILRKEGKSNKDPFKVGKGKLAGLSLTPTNKAGVQNFMRRLDELDESDLADSLTKLQSANNLEQIILACRVIKILQTNPDLKGKHLKLWRVVNNWPGLAVGLKLSVLAELYSYLSPAETKQAVGEKIKEFFSGSEKTSIHNLIYFYSCFNSQAVLENLCSDEVVFKAFLNLLQIGDSVEQAFSMKLFKDAIIQNLLPEAFLIKVIKSLAPKPNNWNNKDAVRKLTIFLAQFTAESQPTEEVLAVLLSDDKFIYDLLPAPKHLPLNEDLAELLFTSFSVFNIFEKKQIEAAIDKKLASSSPSDYIFNKIDNLELPEDFDAEVAAVEIASDTSLPLLETRRIEIAEVKNTKHLEIILKPAEITVPKKRCWQMSLRIFALKNNQLVHETITTQLELDLITGEVEAAIKPQLDNQHQRFENPLKRLGIYVADQYFVKQLVPLTIQEQTLWDLAKAMFEVTAEPEIPAENNQPAAEPEVEQPAAQDLEPKFNPERPFDPRQANDLLIDATRASEPTSNPPDSGETPNLVEEDQEHLDEENKVLESLTQTLGESKENLFKLLDLPKRNLAKKLLLVMLAGEFGDIVRDLIVETLNDGSSLNKTEIAEIVELENEENTKKLLANMLGGEHGNLVKEILKDFLNKEIDGIKLSSIVIHRKLERQGAGSSGRSRKIVSFRRISTTEVLDLYLKDRINDAANIADLHILNKLPHLKLLGYKTVESEGLPVKIAEAKKIDEVIQGKPVELVEAILYKRDDGFYQFHETERARLRLSLRKLSLTADLPEGFSDFEQKRLLELWETASHGQATTSCHVVKNNRTVDAEIAYQDYQQDGFPALSELRDLKMYLKPRANVELERDLAIKVTSDDGEVLLENALTTRRDLNAALVDKINQSSWAASWISLRRKILDGRIKQIQKDPQLKPAEKLGEIRALERMWEENRRDAESIPGKNWIEEWEEKQSAELDELIMDIETQSGLSDEERHEMLEKLNKSKKDLPKIQSEIRSRTQIVQVNKKDQPLSLEARFNMGLVDTAVSFNRGTFLPLADILTALNK